MPLPQSAAIDFDRALKSYIASAEALEEFQRACQMGNEPVAELARAKVLGSMESFMDNYAAAYMRS